MYIKPKKKYLDGTGKILLASTNEQRPYTANVAGLPVTVLPNVFSPKYFRDTAFFARALPKLTGEDFLEIGPGTGALSIFAVRRGAKRVVAIDINPAAVRNTRLNVVQHRLQRRIKVLRGNVYSPLKRTDRFDTIFWNTPFGFVRNKTITMLERSIIDPHYRSTERFIRGAARHLKPRGRLLIGFSTTLGDIGLLRKLLQRNNFRTRLLKRIRSRETHPVLFQLYEAKLTPRDKAS